MNRMVVITRSDQASGYRMAGVDAIGVENAEGAQVQVTALLNKKEALLLAIDDGLFAQLPRLLVNRIYAAPQVQLVTLPEAPGGNAGGSGRQGIYDMIRHATGVQIHFKGEAHGTTK